MLLQKQFLRNDAIPDVITSFHFSNVVHHDIFVGISNPQDFPTLFPRGFESKSIWTNGRGPFDRVFFSFRNQLFSNRISNKSFWTIGSKWFDKVFISILFVFSLFFFPWINLLREQIISDNWKGMIRSGICFVFFFLFFFLTGLLYRKSKLNRIGKTRICFWQPEYYFFLIKYIFEFIFFTGISIFSFQSY